MAINTHQADHVEYIQDSNGNKHYLNAEYLDGHSYGEISKAIGGKGTVTSVATADGITGGTITTSGTIKANLKSYTKNTAEIGGRLYGVELDKNGKLAVNVPWTDTNTDTKVTSAANHYTPAADSSAQLSVDASSATAATWDKTALVTGVNLQRDSKGHVTGVTVDSIKMPANPNTDTHYTNYLQIKGNSTEAVKFTQDSNKTLNLKPGTNVSISAASGEITINATDTNTSHNHNVGIGLVGSGSAGTGGGTYTYKAKLRSETALTVDSVAATTTSGRVYPVAADKSGYLSVNVPWTDTHADISNLVPYTGASKDVNLVDHALFISDKTSGNVTMIKVSGKHKSEDDTSIAIHPGNIELTGTEMVKANLATGGLKITDKTYTTTVSKSGIRTQFSETLADGGHKLHSSTYGYDGILHSGKKLLLPENAGTIALTSDLPTTQQWTLTDVNGNGITVNICVK